MIIEINGKERELKFGIGFVRKLDELYRAEVEGIEFGVGLAVAQLQLSQKNPAALSDVIHCAIVRGSTTNAIDSFVEDYAEENEGLDSLFEEVLDSMGKSYVVKSNLEKLNQQVPQ